MKENRRIPFGYCMKEGVLEPHPKASVIVLWIYSSYSLDLSFLKMAEELSKGSVPYHSHTPIWNKNMVKRILEDSRYLGTDLYASLITKDLFERAQQIRISKQTHVPKRRSKPTKKTVTVIPPTKAEVQEKPLNVAAYCRVSTNDPEQLSSYEAQIAYFEK